MYSFASKIRYSETDENGKLSIGSIINYFQDCSLFQSEELGIGVEFLKNENRAWVLKNWNIEFIKDIRFLDNIVIHTIPYELKGIAGKRNFFIENEFGEILVKADSQWVYLDTQKMIPIRTNGEKGADYVSGEKIDMEYMKVHICIGDDYIEKKEYDSFTVKKQNIDTNGHVNNGQYVMFALEYIPEDFKISRLLAEYKVSARYGNIIKPVVYYLENKIIVELLDEEDKEYAIIEFITVGQS